MPKRSSQAPSARISAPPRSSALQVPGEVELARRPRRIAAARPTKKPSATASPPSSGMLARRLTLRSFGRSTAPSASARRADHAASPARRLPPPATKRALPMVHGLDRTRPCQSAPRSPRLSRGSSRTAPEAHARRSAPGPAPGAGRGSRASASTSSSRRRVGAHHEHDPVAEVADDLGVGHSERGGRVEDHPVVALGRARSISSFMRPDASSSDGFVGRPRTRQHAEV